MARPRLVMLGMALAAFVAGCAPGAPQRASDIQNLNGISDDISAVNMTQSESLRTQDPNAHTTLPHGDQVDDR
jgi:hypothetical protein